MLDYDFGFFDNWFHGWKAFYLGFGLDMQGPTPRQWIAAW